MLARAPGGDFDLNVLIRTLFVNVQTAKGMVGAGGAITIGSECALNSEKPSGKQRALFIHWVAASSQKHSTPICTPNFEAC